MSLLKTILGQVSYCSKCGMLLRERKRKPCPKCGGMARNHSRLVYENLGREDRAG